MTSLSFVKVKTKYPFCFILALAGVKFGDKMTLRLPRTRTVTNGNSELETSAPYGKIFRLLLDAYRNFYQK